VSLALVSTVLGACTRGQDAELVTGPGAGSVTTASAGTPGVAPDGPVDAGGGPATSVPGATGGVPVPGGGGGGGGGAPGPGSGNGPDPTSPPAPQPPPAPPSGLATVRLKLSRIAGFDEPFAMAARPNDGGLYVAEKRGRIRVYRNGNVEEAPVLDLSGEVATGTEQGLLGLIFSPDGGRLYVNYTDTQGDTRIVEYGMAGGQADPATRRELLLIDQPAANNNGGGLAFSPDGKLFIGMGDGGGGGDPNDNAQRLDTLLGKLLRIDPRPSATGPYTIPPDNPFIASGSARHEIWAYGLRNPTRISFDRATGDLWIADRGQNAREEIDFQRAGTAGGQNYGWARLEGTKVYSGVAPATAIGPLFDYGRAGGACAVTGGYVYRGNRIPGLVGAYIFGDQCVGRITAIRQANGQITDQRPFPQAARPLVAFGQDGAGELYAVSLDGDVVRIDPD
jgi:glucose/arabinose dehydrogenase